MDALEVIKNSGLLPDETNAKQLDMLAKLSTPVQFEAGTVIGKQGKEANKLYVVEEGLVSIILEVEHGHERVIQTVTRFDIIGWSAIVPPYRYTTTTKTNSKTKVLAFDGQALTELLVKNPRLGYAIYSGIAGIVAKRLHNTYLQLIGIT